MTEYIYKYFRFDDNLINTLKESYLWFSNADAFNDPFEFKLQGPKNLTDEDIMEYYHLMKTLDGNRIDEVLQGHIEAFLFAYKNEPEKFLDFYLIPFRSRINKFGLCCFSENFDDILMWSHYSDSHKGLVIKFDKNKLDESIYLNNDLGMTVIDSVSYSKDFPFIKMSRNQDDTAKSVRNIVFTKAINWEYENEIRILSDQVGKHNFDINCIEEIIFGAKFMEIDKVQIIEILNHNYSDSKIVFSQMRISKRKFALEKIAHNNTVYRK